MPGPDGAFAPSETFSPNLPVPINGRPRIKRSGRGECPVPPRLMGHTPSGSGAFAPSETFFPDLPVPINGRPRIKRSGRGECPVPPRLMGHSPSGLLALAALAYPVLFGDGRSIMGRTGHSPRPKRFPRTCRFQSTVGDGSNVRDGANAPSRRGG